MTKANIILQTKITKSASKLNKYTLLYRLKELCLKEKTDLKIEDYEISYIKNIDTLFLQKPGFRRQLKDLSLVTLQQVFSVLQESESQ